MGSGNELGRGTPRDVRLKNLVRVVKVGEDDGKASEILLQLGRQLAASSKKAGQRTGFDGPDLIGQSAGQGKLGNVLVTEHLEVGVWKVRPQGPQDRKRENEV